MTNFGLNLLLPRELLKAVESPYSDLWSLPQYISDSRFLMLGVQQLFYHGIIEWFRLEGTLKII